MFQTYIDRTLRKMRIRRRLREIRAGKTRLRSLPATVNMEFSGRCNVWPPCTYCVGKHVKGYQEPPPISEEQLKPYWKYLLAADRVNDTTYGEPLMYPHIHELIDRLGNAGVKFGFTSNGLLLTEKKARLLAKHSDNVSICISINAASKEVYYLHQGKDFNKLIANIEKFISVCRTDYPDRPVPLMLSFIVMRSNQHEVMDFVRLAKRLGAPTILFRHLFELGEDRFEVDVFGQHFVYGRERLAFEEYKEIERRIRESEDLKDGTIQAQFA
jgi:MoaA/NifB/PqqE/SkfB family radical SAM enzyme